LTIPSTKSRSCSSASAWTTSFAASCTSTALPPT
jgi:hypothetical protein